MCICNFKSIFFLIFYILYFLILKQNHITPHVCRAVPHNIHLYSFPSNPTTTMGMSAASVSEVVLRHLSPLSPLVTRSRFSRCRHAVPCTALHCSAVTGPAGERRGTRSAATRRRRAGTEGEGGSMEGLKQVAETRDEGSGRSRKGWNNGTIPD